MSNALVTVFINLLMLVNTNTAVHCTFMLVYSPLTNVN